MKSKVETEKSHPALQLGVDKSSDSMQICWDKGGATWPFNQLLFLKSKVTENTVTISLDSHSSAWPTVDQISCTFQNIGGMMPPHPPHKYINHIGNGWKNTVGFVNIDH